MIPKILIKFGYNANPTTNLITYKLIVTGGRSNIGNGLIKYGATPASRVESASNSPIIPPRTAPVIRNSKNMPKLRDLILFFNRTPPNGYFIGALFFSTLIGQFLASSVILFKPYFSKGDDRRWACILKPL